MVNVQSGSNQNAAADDEAQAIDVGDIDIGIDERKQGEGLGATNNLQQDVESKEQIFRFIEKTFSQPLMANIWKTIDDNRRQAHKRRTWNLRKQEKQIESAQEMKSKWLYQGPVGVNIKNKLNQIISDYTNEREKIEISQALLDPPASEEGQDKDQVMPYNPYKQKKHAAKDEAAHVPAHLAISQCVISAVKDQFKVVNKCMLHMMYRKLNLLGHLKALRLFYLSGQGDILEQFTEKLFHNN